MCHLWTWLGDRSLTRQVVYIVFRLGLSIESPMHGLSEAWASQSRIPGGSVLEDRRQKVLVSEGWTDKLVLWGKEYSFHLE